MMERWIAWLVTAALLSSAGAAFAGGSRGGHGRSSPGVAFVKGSGGAHSKPGSVHHRPSFHHHRRAFVGSTIFIGAVGVPYYYYPAPAYAAPPAYVEEPVTYIEQPAAEQVFYYCPDSRAYYPNVTTCPSPWLKVVP
jgi:hypothetical protein